MAKKSRPILVSLIALLYLLSGLIFLVTAVGVFAGFTETEGGTEMATLGVSLVGALISIILFYGFWKGWSIFWYLGVLFTIIGAIGGIAAVFSGGLAKAVPLIIDILILIYLFSKKVKHFFLD